MYRINKKCLTLKTIHDLGILDVKGKLYNITVDTIRCFFQTCIYIIMLVYKLYLLPYANISFCVCRNFHFPNNNHVLYVTLSLHIQITSEFFIFTTHIDRNRKLPWKE